MKKKITKLFCAIFLLGLIFSTQNFVLGQGSTTNSDVQALNDQIASKRSALEDLQAKQKEYSATIQKKQSEQASLANQIAILNASLAKTELDLEATKLEIDQTNLEIKKTTLEIETKTKEIAQEKDHIGNILKLIYKQDQVSTLEMMLANNSLSDYLDQMKYLEDVNGEVVKSLDNLKEYKTQLEQDKADLDKKNTDLTSLKAELEDKKTALQNQTDSKNYLLAETRSSEKTYQKLLTEAKQEQVQAENDISSLEKTVRQKLASSGDDKNLEVNENGLIWPVPKNTITSYFHDPDYPFRYLFEHPAVDIRAGQGTQLKAAASGYVAQAKDGGKGYSYIMIVHANGLSTVYGHVSKIYVKANEYVDQGDVIGLSGGMPGTPGAGPFTTGPHLHFEVRLNGVPVDPLGYLP